MEKEFPGTSRNLDQLVLPSLNLNDDESDCSDNDELEPIVYHPTVSKDFGKSDEVVPENVSDRTNEVNVENSTIEKDPSKQLYLQQPVAHDEPKLDLSEITEIELDIIRIDRQEPRNSVRSVPYDSSLSDSGSSGCSLMGKLESAMSYLKERSDQEESIIQKEQALGMHSKKNIDLKPELDNSKHNVLDIRVEREVPVNKIVADRYVSCSKEVDQFDLSEERDRIKQESHDIVRLNNGSTKQNSNKDCTTAFLEEDQILPNYTTEHLYMERLNSMNSTDLVESVDDMLENVNKILYQTSDPGDNASVDLIGENGEVTTLFHETNTSTAAKTGNDELEEGVTNSIFQDPSMMSVDKDSSVSVVEWGDVNFPITQPSCYSMESSPVKLSGEINVYDSLFEKSFLLNKTETDANLKTNESVINSKRKKNTSHTEKKQPENPLSDIIEEKNNSRTSIAIDSNFHKKENTVNPDSAKHVEVTRVDKQSYEKIREEVNIFRKELTESIIQESYNKGCKVGTERNNAIRELMFAGQAMETKILNDKVKSKNITQCVACLEVSTNSSETPLKHLPSCKMAAINFSNNEEKPVVKATCSTGVSTDDLANYDALFKSEKENISEKQNNQTSKSKKKKKKKRNSKETSPSSDPLTNMDEEQEKPPPQHLQKMPSNSNQSPETLKQIDDIVNEFYELTGQPVLIASDVSLKCDVSLIAPVAKKQFLVLKIPLESPGFCKGTTNDAMNCVVDSSQNENFFGLVVLFLYLLQANPAKYQNPSFDVPFDVVSMFQCHLDEDLFLIIGICENDKTHLQKTRRRTKLGSDFFHAVSQFINANSLDVLIKHLPNARQIPGKGKLSSFINIVSDENFLNRLIAITPSVTSYSTHKPLKFSNEAKLDELPTESQTKQYTKVFFPKITHNIPQVIDEFLKKFYKKSKEIAGLKVAYVPTVKDKNSQETFLIICTQVDPPTTTKVHNRSLETSLKKTYTSDVVHWFGPHFKGMEDMRDSLSIAKSNYKNATSSAALSAKKKKWSAKLYFISSVPISVVVVVSSMIPSRLLPALLEAARDNGITLKYICRNTLATEQLSSFGILESNTAAQQYRNATAKDCIQNNNSKRYSSFTFLQLYGINALIKLKILTEELTEFLNKSTQQMNTDSFTSILQHLQKIPNLRDMLKTHRSQVGSGLTSKDYFAVLRLNEQSAQLGSCSNTFTKKVNKLSVIDFHEKLTNYCSVPKANLVLLVIYGNTLLARLSQIIKVCFLGHQPAQECQSSGVKINSRKLLLTKSLVGIKYIPKLSYLELEELVLESFCYRQFRTKKSLLDGQPVSIVLIKTEDEQRMRDVRTSLSSFVFSAKVDSNLENIIVHSDSSYVFYLMLKYFHPKELFDDYFPKERFDNGVNDHKTKVFSVYLEETHPLVCDLERIYGNKIQTLQTITATKEKVDAPISATSSLQSSVSSTNRGVIHEIDPFSISYPWKLLLSEEPSFVGFSAKYTPGNSILMAKAVSRLVRMGFQIVGWRFPVYREESYWLNVVFRRAEAIFMMERMTMELESTFTNLHIKDTKNVADTLMYIKDNFCTEKHGGVFDLSYASLINQINFKGDGVVAKRSTRVVEWHPTHDAIQNFGLGFMYNNKSRFNLATNENLLETIVVILPGPLITGTYLGKPLPRRCVFPELWQTFESVAYKTLASKMTSLNEVEADEVLTQFNLQPNIKNKKKTFLTTIDKPFMVVVLLGVCIQSNFWLEMERYLEQGDKELEALKKHLLVASSKNQVEYLTSALFDQVLPNGKIEVRTSMI